MAHHLPKEWYLLCYILSKCEAKTLCNQVTQWLRGSIELCGVSVPSELQKILEMESYSMKCVRIVHGSCALDRACSVTLVM